MSEFQIVTLSGITPEPVRWLWEGRLALGKLTLVGGDPDEGKSLITIDVAARLSRGTHWPSGPISRRGSTIFVCSEDAVADTIRPRAEAAGADLDRIHVLKPSTVENGKRRTFNLQSDLGALGDAARSIGGAVLIVMDAITSYMGAIDGHSTTDVRAVLEPVAEFAEGARVAIVGVTHPPKASSGSAIRSFTGSYAYVAASRMALYVIGEPNTKRRLLLPVKNILGPLPRGIGYSIIPKQIACGIEAPRIVWDDAPADVTADQAIAAATEARRRDPPIGQAKDFLTELLADDPVDAKEVAKQARAEGISARTLSRAKSELHVRSKKTARKIGNGRCHEQHLRAVEDC